MNIGRYSAFVHVGGFRFDFEGSFVLCWKACWICTAHGFTNECLVCGGCGYVEMPLCQVDRSLLALAQREAQLRYDVIHQQALLVSRYGTAEPLTIRDYWRIQE